MVAQLRANGKSQIPSIGGRKGDRPSEGSRRRSQSFKSRGLRHNADCGLRRETSTSSVVVAQSNACETIRHKTLTDLRKRAVTSVQEGQSPELVAKALSIHRVTIYGWLSRYRNGGWGALDASKRGGRPPNLDGKAMQWIDRAVTMKNPLQMKFTYALWTAKMIGQMICRRFGVQLSKPSACRLLVQLGLTPQRPVWRAYRQKPEEVQRWLEKDYPKIRSLARKEKAQLFFGDEAEVRSDHHAGTTWAVTGKTPVVSSRGARFSLNKISPLPLRESSASWSSEGKSERSDLSNLSGDRFMARSE